MFKGRFFYTWTNFHPEIITHLGDLEIQYHTRLPSALDISIEIIAEIDAYNEHLAQNNYFQCLMSFCEFEYVRMDIKLNVKYQTDDEYNPNQLSLFSDIILIPKEIKIDAGFCPHCEILHFDCPECNEITCANDAPDFSCTSCGTTFELKQDSSEDHFHLYVFEEDN